jgi:hypothetical protein
MEHQFDICYIWRLLRFELGLLTTFQADIREAISCKGDKYNKKVARLLFTCAYPRMSD